MALQVLAAMFTIIVSSPASSQQRMMDERTQGAGPKDGKTLPMGPNTQWTLVTQSTYYVPGILLGMNMNKALVLKQRYGLNSECCSC